MTAIAPDTAAHGFRPRAREVSRIEAFSDVVFGFALSLLVVSLEVPRTYEDFAEMLRGFLPFAVCFFLFIQIWHKHHTFFRRYALQDKATIALNTVLLFVILFYVYPLKFLFTLFFSRLTSHSMAIITASQQRTIFQVYAAGLMAVFFTISGMYFHALRLRDALELNSLEVIDTLEEVHDSFWIGVVGLASLLLAVVLPDRQLAWAGWVYFAIGVPGTLVPTIMGRRRRKLMAARPPGV